MIEHPRGSIEYDESGAGPTVVLVPGSCSTGAAWRPVITVWNGQFRNVTTSLLGYGGTAERRSASDVSIAHEAAVVEAVIAKAGGRVHLVGHSFGGLVSLAVALRAQVKPASLVIVEAPAVEVLRDRGELVHYGAFHQMTDRYFARQAGGDTSAVADMIDFYGGAGTFASWPPRLRDYVIETAPVNILDWATAYGFPLPAAALAAVDLPVLVVRGGRSHPAAQRANGLIAAGIRGATLATIEDAAHFMIATHTGELAHLIAEHVRGVEAAS